MKIREIKKVMKKSNGFLSVKVKGGIILCLSEWNDIKYHKKGVSVDNAEYLPYNWIKKVIKER